MHLHAFVKGPATPDQTKLDHTRLEILPRYVMPGNAMLHNANLCFSTYYRTALYSKALRYIAQHCHNTELKSGIT